MNVSCKEMLQIFILFNTYLHVIIERVHYSLPFNELRIYFKETLKVLFHESFGYRKENIEIFCTIELDTLEPFL